MKARADELEIPEVAGTRIGGCDENEENPEPSLRDLAGLRGALPGAADHTVWMHRPHVYNKNLPGDFMVVELSAKVPFRAEGYWGSGALTETSTLSHQNDSF